MPLFVDFFPRGQKQIAAESLMSRLHVAGAVS